MNAVQQEFLRGVFQQKAGCPCLAGLDDQCIVVVAGEEHHRDLRVRSRDLPGRLDPVQAGQAVPGYRVYAVQVSWEPLPLAQLVVGAALPAAEPYRLPAPEQTLAVVPVAERFQLAVPLEQPGRPGLSTLLLWALDPAGRTLPVAAVSVLAETPPPP
jgi:hypothetical protein